MANETSRAKHSVQKPPLQNGLWDCKRINTVLESIADGVFTVDTSGRITSWNRAMERITGFSADEAMGQPCSIIECSQCAGGGCPESLHDCRILSMGEVDSVECSLRHKDGGEIPILKSARVLRDDAGAAFGVVETLTDLTELQRARRRADEATRRLSDAHQFANIIGKSSAMRQVFTALERAAASEAAILIQGPTGTGKELAAGAIHYQGARAQGPLVTVNCSALSESLLESELFGHVRGAFTGAVRDRAGRFEEAQGGTVFLDEIGEVSPLIQVKLLRVLQEHTVERVGESRTRKVDIRIIAATNRDLMQRVREGYFREDLYYRLKVFPITMPSLRERREDIPLLVDHFIRKFNQKTGKSVQRADASAMRMLMDYHWPGNVRELENAIEHAFVLAAGEELGLFDLPVEIRRNEFEPRAHAQAYAAPAQAPARRRGTLHKDELLARLQESNWNKAEVGRRVGLSRTAVWKYMKKWDIPLENPGEQAGQD
jgi:PAS domain S-box-containing protein